MASIWNIVRSTLTKRNPNLTKFYHNLSSQAKKVKYPLAAICVIGGTVALYTVYKHQRQLKNVNTLYSKPSKRIKLSSREKRFIKFASAEYDGQIYMTPQDFLESVIEAEPRPRFKRRTLTSEEIEKIRTSTPMVLQGSKAFFRNLGNSGIITYTEYLFLLSILVRPRTGFYMAFNMMDTDGNGTIDKHEFLVMEKIFSNAWKGKRGISSAANKKVTLDDFVDDELGLQKRHRVETTLLVHFFGPKGIFQLDYNHFKQFMLNLQTEILELEFTEFSKGLPTISEADFARILLRYTYLNKEEYETHLDQLLSRVTDSIGISFEEFKTFFQFLNNLEDFSVAMRTYNLANHAISEEEFHRAVKICTGKNISSHLVHTVFAIFDDNGDGLLSYREFIALMKDRLHRGLRTNVKATGFKAFKRCVRQEMEIPLK